MAVFEYNALSAIVISKYDSFNTSKYASLSKYSNACLIGAAHMSKLTVIGSTNTISAVKIFIYDKSWSMVDFHIGDVFCIFVHRYTLFSSAGSA